MSSDASEESAASNFRETHFYSGAILLRNVGIESLPEMV